jgi:hypothetical protein
MTAIIDKPALVLPKFSCLLFCRTTFRALQAFGMKMFLDPRQTFLRIYEFGDGRNHCSLLSQNAQIDYMSLDLFLQSFLGDFLK